MKYVYMVQFDWSTTDAEGIEIELFKNYDDAYARYKEIIANELNPEMSWVGSEAFDENGNISDGYELDEGENFWHVVDKNDYYCHSFIDLIKNQKATELLKQLNIYEPYIEGFIDENNVCFFENYAGFWVYQEPEIEAKIKAIEKKYRCLVYAVTHEFTEFGELYSFLIVTDYPEEMDHLLYNEGNNHYAFAYVWNKTYEQDSEFGMIGVKSFGGGIKRFA